jgi:hypothetical protein
VPQGQSGTSQGLPTAASLPHSTLQGLPGAVSSAEDSRGVHGYLHAVPAALLRADTFERQQQQRQQGTQAGVS